MNKNKFNLIGDLFKRMQAFAVEDWMQQLV
jgi:hypothetical protein